MNGWGRMIPALGVVLSVTSGLVTLPCKAGRPHHRNTALGTHLTAEQLGLETSRLAGAIANENQIGGARSRFSALYVAEEAGWSVALGHEYNALEIDLTGSEPQTNGDLHTLHIAGTLARPLAGGHIELALAPALSVSSNVLKNPGEIDRDSLQLRGSAVWRRPHRAMDWVLGIVHDYRFGESRAYATAGFAWKNDRVALWVTYPDVVLDWTLSRGWKASLALQPDGNQWQVLDKPLERSSAFRREAWQLEARLAYRWRNGLSLGFVGGTFLKQRWRFALRDDAGLVRNSADSAFAGVQLGWYR